ncbi:hypothetical protein [Gimesia sp.]|uniref:hypothetical protein n=1 Tax=Gimesia sp. TaxID=2024833 RepID=UPI0032EF25FC
MQRSLKVAAHSLYALDFAAPFRTSEAISFVILITAISGSFCKVGSFGLIDTIRKMCAIATNPKKDKTDISSISHLIRTTYKISTTQPFAITAHDRPRQIPILFRLLYNGFNTFDKNSCRIDYADRSAEDDLIMRQTRTTSSPQRESVCSNLLIPDGRDKKGVGAKKEPSEVIF